MSRFGWFQTASKIFIDIERRSSTVRVQNGLRSNGFISEGINGKTMNIRKVTTGLIFAAGVYQASADDFAGSFSGFYAPGNWNVAVSGNATYQGNASVDITGAPNQVVINGATGANGVPDVDTPSIIDYSIVVGSALPPSGTQTPVAQPVGVAFTYIFFDPFSSGGSPPPGPPDSNTAEVLQNGTVVGFLNPGTSTYETTTTFFAGDTLTLRVISGNTTPSDTLTITLIPEPSTLALAGLGGAALLMQLRRKHVKN